MRIELHFGDTTEYVADCVLNAAKLTILEFCKTFDGCSVGEVKLLPGFNLPSKNIIHTVGPRYLFKPESEIED